jgi:hypothetical protein
MAQQIDDIALSRLPDNSKTPGSTASYSTTRSDDQKTDNDEALHGLRLVLTIVSLGLSVFLVALDGTIVSTAVPRITDEFNAVNDIGWVSASMFQRDAGSTTMTD